MGSVLGPHSPGWWTIHRLVRGTLVAQLMGTFGEFPGLPNESQPLAYMSSSGWIRIHASTSVASRSLVGGCGFSMMRNVFACSKRAVSAMSRGFTCLCCWRSSQECAAVSFFGSSGEIWISSGEWRSSIILRMATVGQFHSRCRRIRQFQSTQWAQKSRRASLFSKSAGG